MVILPLCSHLTPYITELPKTQKSAYKRPYKSRKQRRENDRRKNNKSRDVRFLMLVIVGVALVMALALALMRRGEAMSPVAPAAIEALQ